MQGHGPPRAPHRQALAIGRPTHHDKAIGASEQRLLITARHRLPIEGHAVAVGGIIEQPLTIGRNQQVVFKAGGGEGQLVEALGGGLEAVPIAFGLLGAEDEQIAGGGLMDGVDGGCQPLQALDMPRADL